MRQMHGSDKLFAHAATACKAHIVPVPIDQLYRARV